MKDRHLFDAEGLRQIERVNAEIERNSRRGELPARPLLDVAIRCPECGERLDAPACCPACRVETDRARERTEPDED